MTFWNFTTTPQEDLEMIQLRSVELNFSLKCVRSELCYFYGTDFGRTHFMSNWRLRESPSKVIFAISQS